MNAKVMLGADPEFLMLDENNKAIRSGEFFCENIYDKHGRRIWGKLGACEKQIGADGGGVATEFRPTPAIDGKGLRNNTRRLMKQFKDKYKDLKLSTYSDAFPLGAHFHFGIAIDGEKCRSYCPSAKLLFMLDIAMGIYLMDKSGEGRKMSGYARASKFNVNDHGFEYRTPSALAFTKPKYVEVIGKIFQSIVQYCISHTGRIERSRSERLTRITNAIKSRVLTKEDKLVIQDMENYRANYSEDITKYWLEN